MRFFKANQRNRGDLDGFRADYPELIDTKNLSTNSRFERAWRSKDLKIEQGTIAGDSRVTGQVRSFGNLNGTATVAGGAVF